MRKIVSVLVIVIMLLTAVVTPMGQFKAFAEAGQTIFINEVMAANTTTIRDGDVEDPEYGSQGGTYSDWIEIYNSSLQSVDLTGYSLSDSSATWTFPKGTVPANGYVLVWASDKNKVARDGQAHTNFKLSSSGEPLTLKKADGTVVDSVTYETLGDNESYGRKSDGATDWVVFSKTSPRSANIYSAAATTVKEPAFSQQGGFYTQAFDLELTTSEAGVKIYYSKDGSDPAPEASGTTEYTGSINIKSRAGEPNVLSMIKNISTDPNAPWMAPLGEVFKCSTIKAVAVRSDGKKSEVVTQTYFVDPNMKTRYSIPVISLVTEKENFFDNSKGIYVNGNFEKEGPEWERPIHVEYFEKDGTLGFSQYAGVRIHGGWTKKYPQKSFRLYADGGYDDTDKFKYEVLPGLKKKVSGKKLTSFSRLVLRNAGNDWIGTYFRDEVMQSLVSHLPDLDTQVYRPAVAFLNGEYWGLYNIRERYDGEYLASHYDLDKNKVAILDVYERPEAQEGTAEDVTAYTNDIMNYLKSNSITLKSTYDNIKTKMDVESFMDCYISQIFFGNTDWPGNNVSIWKYKTDDGKYHPEAPPGQDGRWKWFLKDTDFGFGLYGKSVTHNTLNFATAEYQESYANAQWSTLILRTLLQQPEFRNEFINRFADYLNTAFDSTRVNQKIDEAMAAIAAAMPEESNRWQAIKMTPTTNPQDKTWDQNVLDMKSYATARPAIVRQHIQSKFSTNGVTGTAAIKLSTDTTKGYVKINTVDVKTTTPGITNASAWTGIYFKGVPVTVKAIPATGYQFDYWEGVTGVTGTSDTITFTPTGDMNITAVFKASQISDTTAPVIKLNGNAGVGLKLGDVYKDSGATATDDVDGDISSRIEVQGSVSTNVPGTYTLTYRVADSAGNTAEAKRTVVVAALDPQAYDLSAGTYAFTNWSSEAREGTYPQNMVFLQTALNDTKLEDEMTAPYCNVDGLAYNNTSRTRINGLNENGIAFINTGKNADLGAAVLALNTTGQKNIKVNWTGGTVLPNSRTYAILLQYRIGKSGPFTAVTSSGSAVEYVKNIAGHSQTFSDISLPAEVENQPYVELRWKYYLKGSETSGARAQLRLDDISISSESGNEQPIDNYTINVDFTPKVLTPNMFFKAQVNAKNNNGEYPSVLAIVALYDKDNHMVNISYISKNIAIGASDNLSAGFKLPTSTAGYSVKVFVWDGDDIRTSNMQPLSNVVTVQ